MPDDQPFHFDGFSAPGYTMVPDEYFDRLLAHLTGPECKVLSYIFRRTFGFKKDADQISLSQMVRGITTRDGRVLDQGVGESRTVVIRALDGLITKGVIVKHKAQSERHGFETNTYAIVMKIGDTPSPLAD